MKKILIMLLLLCSFASAIDIQYGDGNCDTILDINDIEIMIQLLNNETPTCCFNENISCSNMDINNNNTFDSGDLSTLSESIYGSFTLPKYSNLTVIELLYFHANSTVFTINNTWYIQNHTNYTNFTKGDCISIFNLSASNTSIIFPNCETCETCETPTTVEVEVEVEVEKEVWWNWKVGLLILFISILGLVLGYTYAINYGV